MSTVRLLHLSDIHFTSVVDHDRRVHDDVRDRLLDIARDLARNHAPIHGIVVAGDVAFSGSLAEYRQAANWLEQVAQALGCPKTAVYTVPGNHDINLGRMSPITKQIHRYYRGLPVQRIRQEIDELAKGPATEGFLIEKLRDYHDFASSYGCDFVAPSRPMWSRDLSFDSRRTLRLLGLASVQVSDLEDTKGGLILGSNQYIVDEQDCVEHVVVMHHPFEWLKDHQDAGSYINNRARIIILGHEHLARVQKITEAGCDRLLIESGATTPPDAHAPYTYHFNLLSISLVGDSGDESLNVTVYPHVWSPERTRFVPDTSRQGGAESAEYILRCPRYRQCTGASLVPNVSDAEAMMRNGFVQLRYFFWRYPEWGQRMEILVRAKALHTPTDEQRPFVERLALARVRDEGRLFDLWNLVMEFVPGNRREPNPFPHP